MSRIPTWATSCAMPMHEPRLRSVGQEPSCVERRFGSDEKTSKPQYHVYCPPTVSVARRGPGPPSRRARSPGYGRTLIGAADVPVRLPDTRPVYVPPRSQIVSPGLTADGWLRAVWRLHGVERLPVPAAVLVVPFGAT